MNKQDVLLPPKLKFRNEWKYLISEWEAFSLCQRLEPFMAHDSHAKDGVYMIRSLYFDDMWDSSYNEKLMGVEDRCKWRIRCYNCSDSTIKLERKLKKGAYIHKDSASLTRQETDDIIAGRGEFLLDHPAPLCREFYYEWRTRQYRPKVIVDYDREEMCASPLTAMCGRPSAATTSLTPTLPRWRPCPMGCWCWRSNSRNFCRR